MSHTTTRRRPAALSGRIAPKTISTIAALTVWCATAATSLAVSNSWIAGVNGDYSNPLNWTGGVNVPSGAADVASSDGTGAIINFLGTDTYTLDRLDLNQTSGASIFNHAGSLTLNNLRFGGGGASRNPTYNLTAGTLNTAAFTWGNGSNANFNVSGGTMNMNGTGLAIGIASGARGFINISSGTFNANSLTSFSLGNTGNGQGTLSLSGTGIFNANTIAQINLANNASAAGTAGTILLAGSSQFSATNATVSVGQFGSNATAVGTLTVNDTASFTSAFVTIGGNNAANSGFGIVNLNGGTVTTRSMRLGLGATGVPSAIRNAINANGSTVVASTHANNSDFFLGAFVNVAAGGLKFNTNGNAVGISNSMSGVGGLTKQGDGALTLTGLNSFTGSSVVEGGTLLVNGNSASTSISVNAGATLGGSAGAVGAVSVDLNGTIAPGTSIGTLNSGTLSLATDARFALEIDTATIAGLTGSSDLLAITGDLNIGIGNSTLDLADLGGDLTLAGDTKFTFITYTGAWNNSLFEVGGTPIGDGETFTFGANEYALDYNDGGNSVSLTVVVPEPSAAMAIVGGATLLLGLRRRRQA